MEFKLGDIVMYIGPTAKFFTYGKTYIVGGKWHADTHRLACSVVRNDQGQNDRTVGEYFINLGHVSKLSKLEKIIYNVAEKV